jgi:hypothetical protein
MERVSNKLARIPTSERIGMPFRPGLSKAGTKGTVRNPHKYCWRPSPTGGTG